MFDVDADDQGKEGGGDISHGCHQLSAGVPLARSGWETSGLLIKTMDLDYYEDDHNDYDW